MPRKHTAKHRDNLRWAGAVVAFGHKQNSGSTGRCNPCGDGSGCAENAFAHCLARLRRFGCSTAPSIESWGDAQHAPFRAALGRLVHGPKEGDSR